MASLLRKHCPRPTNVDQYSACSRKIERKTLFIVGGDGLAAARSRSGSDTALWCHSLPSRRFATSTPQKTNGENQTIRRRTFQRLPPGGSCRGATEGECARARIARSLWSRRLLPPLRGPPSSRRKAFGKCEQRCGASRTSPPTEFVGDRLFVRIRKKVQTTLRREQAPALQMLIKIRRVAKRKSENPYSL